MYSCPQLNVLLVELFIVFEALGPPQYHIRFGWLVFFFRYFFLFLVVVDRFHLDPNHLGRCFRIVFKVIRNPISVTRWSALRPLHVLADPTSNIRSSQRLSHACLSTNRFNVKPHKAQYNSYNLRDHQHSYLDNCGKSRANTCNMPGPRRNWCTY